MDPLRFYGTSKYVNSIPGDGNCSDDDIASESDQDYEPISRRAPKRRNVIIPDSDSDFSDDDDIPLKNLQTPSTTNAKKRKTKKDLITWKCEKMKPYDENKFKFKGNTELPESIKELATPADIFKFLFSDDLIDLIVEQSNLKALQDNINKPANITKEDIEKFIGVIIYMSCVKLPATRMYWSKYIGQSQVYETITCNRFEAVKRFLHFNNNEDFTPRGIDGHDKLFKIRPLLDHIRQRLLLVPKEEFLAVDEQIIPTKCRHELKQYNPAKPHKWGYKNQVLSGVSGFSYDFDIFAGIQSNSYPSDAPDLGVSSNVVTRLASTVPRHLNYKICFDNWFNSPKLQVYLFKNGMLPLGTVRLNRVPNSNMPSEKEMKKRGRGSMEEKTAVVDDVKLSLVSWFDNKTVNMLSAYVGSEPTTTKRRYVRQQKEYREITSPQAVDVYNQHMGGVDLLDSMLGYYRIHLRSRQWYKRIFFHMVDMCIVNAWLLWRRINEGQYVALFDFKLAVSEHMRKAGKTVAKKRGRPASILGTPLSSRAGTPSSVCGSPKTNKKPRKTPTRPQDLPLNSVRSDGIDHFPIWTKNMRQLCKNCEKYRSFTKCEKCSVYLCYNDKRNCFKDFHEM